MVLGAAFATLVALDLLAIRAAAAEARSDLSQAVESLSRGETEVAAEHLATARSEVEEAASRASRFEMRAAGAIPWLGREVRVVRGTVESASDMTEAVDVVTGHLASPHPPLYSRGRVDPEAAARLVEVPREVHELLAGARERMEILPSPRTAQVRDGAEEVAERARQGAVAAGAVTALLEDVATSARGEDPFRVLVLFTNGAELRAIGGVPVFLAELEVDDGRLHLAEISSTTYSHPPTAAALTDDLEAVFGVFLPSSRWSNVTLSADGPTVGETAAGMYEVLSGNRPDLVAVVDLVGTGYVLQSIPDVELPGGDFAPSELATDYLVWTYENFDSGREQNEYLVEAIEATFEEMLDREPSGSRLLGAVRRTVEEGRVAVWSSDPAVQEGLSLAGADLALGDDEDRVDVAVQNFGANKLDLHTSIQAQLELETLGCAVIGRLEVGITETTPADLVETLSYRSDANRWWVNTYLPPDAELRALEANGDPSTGGEGTWGERTIASVFVPAPLGGTGTAGFEWIQPIPDSGEITVRTNPTVTEPARTLTGTVPPATDCRPQGE